MCDVTIDENSRKFAIWVLFPKMTLGDSPKMLPIWVSNKILQSFCTWKIFMLVNDISNNKSILSKINYCCLNSKIIWFEFFWERFLRDKTKIRKNISVYSKMIPWELIIILLMMVVFNSRGHLGQLVTTAILKTLHPIWTVLKKYLR